MFKIVFGSLVIIIAKQEMKGNDYPYSLAALECPTPFWRIYRALCNQPKPAIATVTAWRGLER